MHPHAIMLQEGMLGPGKEEDCLLLLRGFQSAGNQLNVSSLVVF
jgi:hypothetical protein